MAAPVTSAFAFHHRFDAAKPQGDQTSFGDSSRDSGAMPRHSTDNFSFPDLDAGQYHSSAAPHVAAVSKLPDFPEFKSFDNQHELFQNNYFEQFAPKPTQPSTALAEPQSAQIESFLEHDTSSSQSVSVQHTQNQPSITSLHPSTSLDEDPAPAPASAVAATSTSIPASAPVSAPQQPALVPGLPDAAAPGQDLYNPQLERHFSSASSYVSQPSAQHNSQDSPAASRQSHIGSRAPLPIPPALPSSPQTSGTSTAAVLTQQAQHHSQTPAQTQAQQQPPRPQVNGENRPAVGSGQPAFTFPSERSNQAHSMSSHNSNGLNSVNGVYDSQNESHPDKSLQDQRAPDALRIEQMRISDQNQEHAMQRSNDSASNRDENGDRFRPSSFFGMERPTAAINASGHQVPVPAGMIPDDDAFFGQPEHRSTGQQAPLQNGLEDPQRRNVDALQQGPRPSSFFGMDGEVLNHAANDSMPALSSVSDDSRSRSSNNTRAESIYRGGISTAAGGTGNGPMPGSGSTGGFGGLGPSGATRPASIAPSVASGPLLDHSHLKVGQKASLLSHGKTLELYRQNAKKTNDPNLIYELAVFMIDAAKTIGSEEGAAPPSPSPSPGNGTNPKPDAQKEELIKEATGLLKKIADRGHPDAQYFLADCYANGIGTRTGKQDFSQAYTYFVLAAKHGHPDAAYRAGTCYEKGWGCRKDNGKALQFYRKSAAQSHPGAMYRLATAELNGELGLKKNAKEGVKWLKRSAEAATPEFPHALHELALLHERGIDNVLFVDPEYSCELLAQAGEMGYAPSAYKLGVNYEYGRMGCPQDGGLSIHMYNIAAQQNHKEACFALTAWYLVGAPGILPQSDTEAYLWAKKAAEQGLAKAEYAVGYFTEMGIGTIRDIAEAKAWYRKAAEHGDKRANQRIAVLQGRGGPNGQVDAGAGLAPVNRQQQRMEQRQEQRESMHEFGRRGQPTSAPFPASFAQSSMTPSTTTNYPTPLAMREAQTAQREQQYMANVAANERAQARAMLQHSPSQGDYNMPSPIAGTMSPPLPQPPQMGLPRPPNMQVPPPTAFSQPQAYPSYPATASHAGPLGSNGRPPAPPGPPMGNGMMRPPYPQGAGAGGMPYGPGMNAGPRPGPPGPPRPPGPGGPGGPGAPMPPGKADLGQDAQKKKKGWFGRS